MQIFGSAILPRFRRELLRFAPCTDAQGAVQLMHFMSGAGV